MLVRIEFVKGVDDLYRYQIYSINQLGIKEDSKIIMRIDNKDNQDKFELQNTLD